MLTYLVFDQERWLSDETKKGRRSIGRVGGGSKLNKNMNLLCIFDKMGFLKP